MPNWIRKLFGLRPRHPMMDRAVATIFDRRLDMLCTQCGHEMTISYRLLLELEVEFLPCLGECGFGMHMPTTRTALIKYLEGLHDARFTIPYTAVWP